MKVEKARRAVLAVEIPRDELALRFAEIAIGLRRPPGTSPADALEQLRRSQPDIVASFSRMADAAVLYFGECVNAGRATS